MRIVVLGATGGSGQHVAQQAISRGHAVTAVVKPILRRPFNGMRHMERADPAHALPDAAADSTTVGPTLSVAA